MKSSDVIIYDTTLRDGTQGEQVNFSAEEKLRIAHRLDDMGFHYIEGGWPGSNPKDVRFFEMVKEQPLRHARLTAFGSTRKPGVRPENCRNLRALLKAGTPAVTIFGKSWDLHVTEILGIRVPSLTIPVRPGRNLAIIIEVAAMNNRQKKMGYNAAQVFSQRISLQQGIPTGNPE